MPCPTRNGSPCLVSGLRHPDADRYLTHPLMLEELGGWPVGIGQRPSGNCRLGAGASIGSGRIAPVVLEPALPICRVRKEFVP
jgi:hypothetical protein